jgi:predicted nucleotidyltransferase
MSQIPRMETAKIGLAEIKDAVTAVFAGQPVRRVDLFGSRAAGQQDSQSDVDLLVDYEPEARIGLFAMGGLREQLAERLGVGVDLVSRAAVEQSRNPIRRKSILSRLVPVYHAR